MCRRPPECGQRRSEFPLSMLQWIVDRQAEQQRHQRVLLFSSFGLDDAVLNSILVFPHVTCVGWHTWHGRKGLPSLARRWFDSQVRPSLDSALRHRVVGSASSLSVVHFPLQTVAVGVGPDSRVYGRSTSPTHARLWSLAKWGHDPFPGGRSARNNHLLVAHFVLI